MRILQLCLSDGMGGLELYALKVINQLYKRGNNVPPVITPHTFIAGRLDEAGIPYNGLISSLPFFPLVSAWRLARLIEKNKVDIVHMHWGQDLTLASMAKWFSRRPVKLIYTRQMEMVHSKKDPYHSLLYKQVDRFIVITRQLYDWAAKNLPLSSDKIALIYYGVPDGTMENEALLETFRDKAGLSPKSFKIALFGRIEEGKGQHLLIKAVEEMVDNGRDVEVVLIGKAMDEDYLVLLMEDIKTRGLSNRIHYCGFHKRPMEIMVCFDVVVLASYNETFGLVLIEAMRQGVAVIGSDAGGVPEIIDDNETGLLFETRNYKSLALKLEKLIEDSSLREQLAKAGKEKAGRMFTEEKHFRELEQIFRSLNIQ